LDDTIKNMLLKQSKRFNRDKEKFQGKYPFKWALELAQNLRALAEGENYLESIRKRITQMGNTLGFVRMIKNASLKDNQNLLKYLPSLLETYTFESVANDLAIGGETLESVKMFDAAVNLMQKQGEDANDFMRKMVVSNEGFTDANDSMLPLKNFFTLIPAVTTCQIDHVVIGRNKLKQNNNKEAFISDDGFALGVAFLLKIFGIDE
jgi:WASH complex subunit 7